MLQIRETRLPLPEKLVKRLKATEQNPRYHAEGNVYNHTLLVLEQFENHRKQFELSEEESTILYWVSILHDIGKPDVTVWKNGRWSARGHEKAGVPIAREFLFNRPEISKEQRQKILDLVRWHNAPLRWIVNNKPGSVYREMATRTDLKLLCKFAHFDVLGRICEGKMEILEGIEQLSELHVPQIEKELGNFADLQSKYQRSGLQKKNALWNALKQDDIRLLEKLLLSEEPVRQIPSFQCVMSIGAGGTEQTQYLQENYPAYVYYNLDDLFVAGDSPQVFRNKMREVKRFLSVYQHGRRPVVLDGQNIEEATRRELADFVRQGGGELQFLFFEQRLEALLVKARNEAEIVSLRQAHTALEIPHPWEAHRMNIVEL